MRRLDAARLARLLGLVPELAMVSVVLRSSDLQWFDYWAVVPEVVNPDGSLAESRLVFYYNGHILAVPNVVYWLNYKLNSGLNSTLGLFVVGLGVAETLLLVRLLPQAIKVRRWTGSLLFVAFATLVFAPQGAHNFARAMSGTAWLLSNCFTLAALLVAGRGRGRWTQPVAILLAGLATLTYGTGLMAWPALVVLALLRRTSRAQQRLVVASSVAAVGSFFWFYERPPAQGDVGFDVSEMTRRSVQVLGSVVAPDSNSAVTFGMAGLLLAAFAIWQAVRTDRETAAVWVAVLVYTILGAAMIGIARGGNSEEIGASSRYASLSALCWSALLVLLVWLRPLDRRILGAGLLVAGMAFVSRRQAVTQVEAWNPNLDELAIAMRMNVSQSYPPRNFDIPNAYADNARRMREIGHYPFSGRFDADCGLLGESLDSDTISSPRDGEMGRLDDFTSAYNPLSVRMYGWVISPDSAVNCVLVVDEDLHVVGAGAYGTTRMDVGRTFGFRTNDVGFNAVARSGRGPYQAIAALDDGRMIRLANELPDPTLLGPGTDGSLEAVDQ